MYIFYVVCMMSVACGISRNVADSAFMIALVGVDVVVGVVDVVFLSALSTIPSRGGEVAMDSTANGSCRVDVVMFAVLLAIFVQGVHVRMLRIRFV